MLPPDSGDDAGHLGELPGPIREVDRHAQPLAARPQQFEHRLEDVGVGDDAHGLPVAHHERLLIRSAFITRAASSAAMSSVPSDRVPRIMTCRTVVFDVR